MSQTVEVYTLTLRAGREKSALPLPSVQQAQPYLAVLSTFSTAGAAKPLPSSTFSYVLRASAHAANYLKMNLKTRKEAM